MSIYTVLLGAFLYITLLFLTAWWVDKRSRHNRKSIVDNPYIYSLSLAVYCTAWTFFGSVGRAATGSLSFLAIYLGPSLVAPLWLLILRKMILISKHQRITSIADFISARFGKSGVLAMLVTLISVAGIVPYISIQLKAVTTGIDILTAQAYPYFKPDIAFWLDASFWVTLSMILFTALFGTRKIDPNERHEGMVAAIALESLLKLIAFWAIGLFVLYSIYQGPSDLFSQAFTSADIRKLFSLSSSAVSLTTWNTLLLLSAIAFLLLPRQFHISVVENTHPQHVRTAMWMLPLYLLLINLFVFPIALAGKMNLEGGIIPDTYVLQLPLHYGANLVAFLVFIGGFSAATGMVIVSSTALSIMISNHLVIPMLIWMGKIGKSGYLDGVAALKAIRRWSIIGVLLLSYTYLKSVGAGYDLVSVGLISFTAVAQFAPAAFGGIFWKGASKQGAIAGLVAGFLVWAYCLPLTVMAESGIIPAGFLENGLFSWHWLNPRALFGLTGMDLISHAAWWSLLFNLAFFIGVSLFSTPGTLTLTQGDLFVNIERYTAGTEYNITRREAKTADLLAVMNRFLGKKRVDRLMTEYQTASPQFASNDKTADENLIRFLEIQLAGSIGASSARLMIESVSKEENISLEEVMKVLEQTQEVLRYSRALEVQSEQLRATTRQLTEANERLKALDKLKADFITTVTHELRTPVTSIKSLSKIILDYRHELGEEKLISYLQILVSESDRISRLTNQVLDIEKINSSANDEQLFEETDLREILQSALTGMEQLFREKEIHLDFETPEHTVLVTGQRDRLTQLIINLLSNAYKFCPSDNGAIDVRLEQNKGHAVITVADNGPGIPVASQEMIFEQFTQLPHLSGKPQGTGLGLYITRQIVERHKGTIQVKNGPLGGACFQVKLPLSKQD